LTVYGVTPAEYTTTNEFIQTVIEQSQYFKEGRITLLRSVELTDTKPTVAKSAAKPATPTAAPEATEPTETEEAPAEAEVETSEGEEADDGDVKLKVEVSCLQDAQDYLQQNYGISSYKVRTRATAQQAAAEHGVEFVGAGFVAVGAAEEPTESAAEE
jgi:hypothetical protein